MASYSMTPTQSGTSYMGGGWGNDIASFGHAAYAGMNNGMQFANNLYDLQRRVALEPYAQKAAIANYNANRKQDELSADTSGHNLNQQIKMGALSDGTTRNNLVGNATGSGTASTGTVGAAGFTGAATAPIASGNIGMQVGVQPTHLSQQEVQAQNDFADALLGNKQWMASQQDVQIPMQPQVVPVVQQPLGATAPVVETAPVAINYTQDPRLANNAWSDGRWYG